MQNLNLRVCNAIEGKAVLKVYRDDGLMRLMACIDFRQGKAIFEPLQHQFFQDDGSATAARMMLDWSKFSFEIFCNGQFQIYETNSGLLVAEAEAYLPLNMMVDPEGAKQQRKYWEDQIKQRENKV